MLFSESILKHLPFSIEITRAAREDVSEALDNKFVTLLSLATISIDGTKAIFEVVDFFAEILSVGSLLVEVASDARKGSFEGLEIFTEFGVLN